MLRSRVATLIFALLSSGIAHAQTSSTGAATSGGTCNIANSGNNNKGIVINCGISQEQGSKIIALLNHALASKDLATINGKLDELLKVAERPTPAPQTSYEQKCEGSACAQGPGAQATLNQFGARKLVMTPAQRDTIRDAMKPFAGITIMVFCHDATPDSTEYAQTLATALKSAGINVLGPSFGTEYRAGGGVPPGLSASFSQDRALAAEALARSLVELGLATPPLTGGVMANTTDKFMITIAPNR